jgi:hypothetical protein
MGIIYRERNIKFTENEGQAFGRVWEALPGEPESQAF